jgi:hypothetical protein
LRLQAKRPRVLATLVIGLLVAAVVIWLVLRGPPEGNPSSGELRSAVEALFGNRCRSDISVREIEYISGPGLPPGMRAAREVVCDADVAAAQPEDETGHPTLAVTFVFQSHAAAQHWIGPDRYAYVGGDWWLGDKTVIAAGGLSPRDWQALRRRLALN